MRPAVVTIAIMTCGAAAGAFLGMRKKPVVVDALVVPRPSGSIKIDGELDEPSWVASPARTGAFPGKPYSDARMLADDTTLYIALYAADEDIETPDDAFRLTFDVRGTKHEIEVTPKCVVTNAPRARAACDTDGTINVPGDEDEEWVVEMALPFADVDIARGVPFGLMFERCDKPKREPRSCTSWSRAVVVP